MQQDISLWVQSSGQNEPDLLSINGERIFPNNNRWGPNLSSLLNARSPSLKIAHKEHLTIIRSGGKYIIKGALSQKDKCNRHRVFTAQIKSIFIRCALKRLQNELAKYDLSYSKECQVSLKSFLSSLTFFLITIISFFIFLAVVLFRHNIV